jgi:molybdopterin biosynthesis enzyme
LEPSSSPPFSKAAMSVLGFLSNDVFASPALSNRLNFVGTVRPSPRNGKKVKKKKVTIVMEFIVTVKKLKH